MSCAHQPVADSASTSEAPLFQFGLLADVQYADKDTVGRRAYREALPLLKECADDFASRDLAFVVQLGDIIDGNQTFEKSNADLEDVLRPLENTGHPLVHVIGNHCLAVPRKHLQQRLDLEHSWYSTEQNGWRFITLDSMALSVHGLDPEAGRKWLKNHPRDKNPQASDWNGGFGAQQLAWLESELSAAGKLNQRVVIFGHHPITTESASPAHLAWDHAEAFNLITASAIVVVYFSGHDHSGGYTQQAGTHFWTLPAMLEATAPSNAYAIVEVWPDRLVVNGIGDVETKILKFN